MEKTARKTTIYKCGKTEGWSGSGEKARITEEETYWDGAKLILSSRVIFILFDFFLKFKNSFLLYTYRIKRSK